MKKKTILEKDEKKRKYLFNEKIVKYLDNPK